MTHRHFKLIVLLLPLFIARSLLPIGFMLAFDEGIAQLVFCPGQLAVAGKPAGTIGQHDAHLAHQGHEHHHGGAQSDSSSQESSHQACPFAFAAAAPLTVAYNFASEPPSSEAIAASPDSAILIVAFRAHPIRGPPTLS